MSLDKVYRQPRELAPVLEQRRRDGAVLVFANGCFELLHVGHVRFLYGAKALGDVLVVAVNTDPSLRAIK